MSMKDIFAAKHPTSWMEFEKGQIDEGELYRRFFRDGRPIDGPGMLADMVRPPSSFYRQGMYTVVHTHPIGWPKVSQACLEATVHVIAAS